MKIHFVKEGDTLYEISKKYGVPVEEIVAANQLITDPDELKVAMKLVIPDKMGDLPGSKFIQEKVPQQTFA